MATDWTTRIQRGVVLWVLLLGLGGPTPGWGAEKSVLTRLQGFIDRMRTLQADFVQEVEAGSRTEAPVESQGYFVAARPGRFLWHYRTPNEQKIISDGKLVWFYEPDLRQATRSSSRTLEGTFARILTSGGKIQDQFTWEAVENPRVKLPAIRLTPHKEEGAFRLIEITLHPQKEELQELLLEDPLGNRSRIRFSAMRINGKVDEKQFQFTLPPGVELIDG